jgi:hypothetical protein
MEGAVKPGQTLLGFDHGDAARESLAPADCPLALLCVLTTARRRLAA